jgi:hypothetical protein
MVALRKPRVSTNIEFAVIFPVPDLLVSRTHIAYECGNFSRADCACPFALHDRDDRQLLVR